MLLVVLGRGAGEAHAEAGLVVIGGTAADRVRATAGAAVEDAARQAGWTLATRRLSSKELDRIVHCKEPTPFPCLPPSLDAEGIERVLVVTVDRATSDTGAPELVLLGKLIVTRPRDVIVNRRFCETCADDRLAQEATTLAQDLLRQLATQSGRTVIELRSEPTGAQIVLDGQRIGVTNASFNTFPGKHVVALEKEGYVMEVVEVTVDEGKTARVSRLLRASATPTPLLPPRRSRLVPGAMMAVGAAGIVGGVVLYSADEDPSPTGGKQYWDTASAGLVTGVAGLAVCGAGFYLWRRASRKTSAPSATLARGAALIGWSGTF
jgi:hypothetical protein